MINRAVANRLIPVRYLPPPSADIVIDRKHLRYRVLVFGIKLIKPLIRKNLRLE